jgi:hypothetical protein
VNSLNSNYNHLNQSERRLTMAVKSSTKKGGASAKGTRDMSPQSTRSANKTTKSTTKGTRDMSIQSSRGADKKPKKP